MGIDEILDDATQIKEFLCAGHAPKMPLGLHLISDILVVPLDVIVVVLHPVLSACDGHAEDKRAHPAKKIAPRRAIVHESVTHERHELPLGLWLRFLLLVPLDDLRVASHLDLPEEYLALFKCPFLDEVMGHYIFRLAVHGVEVVALLLPHMDDLLIHVDSALDNGTNLERQRILKKSSTFSSIG